MEVILDSSKKEIDEIFVKDSCIFFEMMMLNVLLPHLLFDLRIVIFLTKEVRHFSNGENIIDIFNESFIYYLIVTEKEDSALN